METGRRHFTASIVSRVTDLKNLGNHSFLCQWKSCSRDRMPLQDDHNLIKIMFHLHIFAAGKSVILLHQTASTIIVTSPSHGSHLKHLS